MKRGILCAPTEPPIIKALGRVSSVPERHGVDILVPSLRCGIQRKEYGDLVSSLTGDRLAKEVLQMRRLLYRVLIVEGRPAFNSDGEWINGFQKFTLDQYHGAMLSVQREGIMVLQTADVRGTVAAIKETVAWVGKKEHVALSSRPKYLMSKWGTRDSQEWAMWLCQGFDGVGPKVAKAIVDRFGGAPLAWTVTEKELREVPGVGAVRAQRLMRSLSPRPGKPSGNTSSFQKDVGNGEALQAKPTRSAPIS